MQTDLPKKVVIKDGRYYYRHQKKWHKLSRVAEGPTALYTALQPFTSERPATYGQLMQLYIVQGMEDLAQATKPEYIRHINGRLTHHFGHMLLNTIEKSTVKQYLVKRKKQGAAIAGNRERSTFGAVCEWGLGLGYLSENPCRGVKRNRERKSKVYVEDAELKAVLDDAPPAMFNILSVAYLTGLRQTDLRHLKKSQVSEKGIKLDQSKDQKRRFITMTPVLKYVIDRAMALPPDPNAEKRRVALERVQAGERPKDVAKGIGVHVSSVYNWIKDPEKLTMAQQRRAQSQFVFCGPSGRPFSEDGIQSAMKRLAPGFKFRELRPKAATDAHRANSKHNILGHGEQMLSTYLRGLTIEPLR
jgi:integrase